MKRKLIIGAISAVVILGGAVAAGAAKNEFATVGSQKSVKDKEMITAVEAEKVAQAKVNGIVESVELESEFDNKYYEVEIEKENIDYDIHVEAYTGKIISVKEERDDDRKEIVKETETSNQNLLSREKAIEIAEKAVNGKVIEMDRDEENGRIIYEFELATSTGEAELKLDASTGKVLKVEHDE